MIDMEELKHQAKIAKMTLREYVTRRAQVMEDVYRMNEKRLEDLRDDINILKDKLKEL